MILLKHDKNITLTVNSICSFWQLTGIWDGRAETPPLRSWELLDVWPWNFYQMSSTIGRHEIQNNFDITHLICKLQVRKFKKRLDCLLSGNETYEHVSFTKFCRIINIDVKNQPWKFQIDILQIGYITEQSVKCWSVKCRTTYKTRIRSRDFTKLTDCHVINI